MSKPTISISAVQAIEMAPEGGSTRFGATIRPIGDVLGTARLGIMHVEVAPGKRAFPFHNHLGMEEMFVILEGSGTYRFGDQEHGVKAGDVCSAPRGGPETAHQLINTGEGPLKYLGISDMPDPDIVEYPDSGKFSAIAIHPGKTFWDAHFKHIGRREDGLDYWDGEDT